MSAHKTARECISGPVIDGQESEYATMVDVRRTVSNIEAYAAAKVREATEALEAKLLAAEQAAGIFTPEWVGAVWSPIVRLLAKHTKIPPGGSTYVEMLKRIIHERADLRARLEAINAVRAAIHYDCGADMARALNRALDLTRPFKEGA